MFLLTLRDYRTSIEPYGSGSNGTPCGGTRGFCGSCFQKSFDQDGFDDGDSWDGGFKRKEKEASGQRAAEYKQTKDSAALDSKGKDAEAVVEVVCESKAKGDGEKLQSPSDPDVIDCQPSPKPIMSSVSSH